MFFISWLKYCFFIQGISELSDMIIELLQAFRRRSNVLPKRRSFSVMVCQRYVSVVYFILAPDLTDPTNRVNMTK